MSRIEGGFLSSNLPRLLRLSLYEPGCTCGLMQNFSFILTLVFATVCCHSPDELVTERPRASWRSESTEYQRSGEFKLQR